MNKQICGLGMRWRGKVRMTTQIAQIRTLGASQELADKGHSSESSPLQSKCAENSSQIAMVT